MTEETIREKCAFNEKADLIPCSGLSATLDPVKGVKIMFQYNFKLKRHIGSSLILRLGDFRKGGVNANYCFCCGTDISREARLKVLNIQEEAQPCKEN